MEIEGENLQVVAFMLGMEEFGLDIAHVKEVIRLPVISKVPKARDFIEGVINLRGNVIPIVDLRKRFHLTPQEARTNRIIILDKDGITVGGIVDAVLETKTIPRSRVRPAPGATIGGTESEYIEGVAQMEDRLVSLLNIEKLLFFDQREN